MRRCVRSLVTLLIVALLPSAPAVWAASRTPEQAAAPAAQGAPRRAAPAPQPSAQAAPAARTLAQQALHPSDAQETRQQLDELFRQYPPALRRVIQLDPTLLDSADYLAPYPGLAAFVAEHPEVAHDPDFFVGQFEGNQGPPRPESWRMVEDFMQMAGLMTVFFVVASVLVWLLKTVLEYRRWLRLTKLQAEVHGKLLDRFTASEELLAYIKSPSGQRFLDAAPLALDQPAARMSAPVNRILWSLQAGFVLACAGGGLIFVSRRITQDEINQFVSVIGVVVLAIGVGFILSAAGAWLLSKRLGLLSREGRSSDDATAFGPAA